MIAAMVTPAASTKSLSIGSARHRARQGLKVAGQTAQLWFAHNPFGNAAALAFYTLFSLAPIMILVIAVAGLVLGPEAAESRIVTRLQGLIGAEAAEAARQMIAHTHVREAGWLPTLSSIGAIVIGATAVFVQLQRSLNQLWDVVIGKKRAALLTVIYNRLISLLVVGLFGLMIILSLTATVALHAATEFASTWLPFDVARLAQLEPLVSLTLIALFLTLIFRILPDTERPIRWRHTFPGALLAALLFMPGRYLMATYLTLKAPTSAYGAAGSLVVLMLWVYGSALIVLLGAALSRALHDRSATDTPSG